eukprot:1144094-Pelagomonas_calceolata.AAC.1
MCSLALIGKRGGPCWDVGWHASGLGVGLELAGPACQSCRDNGYIGEILPASDGGLIGMKCLLGTARTLKNKEEGHIELQWDLTFSQ